MSPSSNVHEGQHENKNLVYICTRNIRIYCVARSIVQAAFVGEGTSVVHLEPARTSEEIGIREVRREDITI